MTTAKKSQIIKEYKNLYYQVKKFVQLKPGDSVITLCRKCGGPAEVSAEKYFKNHEHINYYCEKCKQPPVQNVALSQ